MRGFFAASLTIVLLGVFTYAAVAESVDMGKLSSDKVKKGCSTGGGTFWSTPEGNNYGCVKGNLNEGPLTGVICDKDGGCVGTHYPKERRQVPADERSLVDLLMYSEGQKTPKSAK
jgi:hypothetical protein